MIFSIFRLFCTLRFQIYKQKNGPIWLVLWSRVTFLMWFSFTCKCILMNCSMMKACARCLCSEWYLNGNYLVVFVSIGVILPLSMLKNLGKTLLWVSVCVCDVVKCVLCLIGMHWNEHSWPKLNKMKHGAEYRTRFFFFFYHCINWIAKRCFLMFCLAFQRKTNPLQNNNLK